MINNNAPPSENGSLNTTCFDRSKHPDWPTRKKFMRITAPRRAMARLFLSRILTLFFSLFFWSGRRAGTSSFIRHKIDVRSIVVRPNFLALGYCNSVPLLWRQALAPPAT
jgi:hypothetical protein